GEAAGKLIHACKGCANNKSNPSMARRLQTAYNKPDYEKLYYELLAEMERLKLKNKQPKEAKVVRDKIINSELSEKQKEKLLKLLEEQTKNSSETQPKSTNYLPHILGMLVIVFDKWHITN
ncbi:16555_t:CDS:2, partial [Gigaspora rosea]